MRGLIELFSLLGISWDIFAQGMRNVHTGFFGQFRRGRKVTSRTRNIRKVQGRKVKVDKEGVPYGVPGAKFARQAFEGRCTMRSGAHPVGMLHSQK